MSVPRKANTKFLDRAFKGPDPVKCYYCGVHVTRHKEPFKPQATTDHVKPMARGGLDIDSNKVICCYGCNMRKGPFDEDEYRAIQYLPDGEFNKVKEEMLHLLGINSPPKYPTPEIMEMEKARIRELRRKDPEPDCQYCSGSGQAPAFFKGGAIMKPPKPKFFECRCTYRPKSEIELDEELA